MARNTEAVCLAQTKKRGSKGWGGGKKEPSTLRENWDEKGLPDAGTSDGPLTRDRVDPTPVVHALGGAGVADPGPYDPVTPLKLPLSQGSTVRTPIPPLPAL